MLIRSTLQWNTLSGYVPKCKWRTATKPFPRTRWWVGLEPNQNKGRLNSICWFYGIWTAYKSHPLFRKADLYKVCILCCVLYNISNLWNISLTFGSLCHNWRARPQVTNKLCDNPCEAVRFTLDVSAHSLSSHSNNGVKWLRLRYDENVWNGHLLSSVPHIHVFHGCQDCLYQFLRFVRQFQKHIDAMCSWDIWLV